MIFKPQFAHKALLHIENKNSLLFCFLAAKEERFRFANGYDQVEDVIGVAQPVRFNSKRHAPVRLIHVVIISASHP